jgi:nicotinate-nucleotide adenylyltransferase
MWNPNKVLLFGLTANPIHNGHLIAAREIMERLEFDSVIFIPSGDHPFKRSIPFKDRLEMVRIAIENEPGFHLSPVEGERAGKSYTVDTIALYAGFQDVYWYIGSDNIEEIPSWHDYERLKRIGKFVAVLRPPDLMQDVIIPEGLKIKIIEIPAIPISSTQIRARVRAGKSIRYLVPNGVDDYIQSHNLFRK